MSWDKAEEVRREAMIAKLERFRVDCILCDYKTGVMTHERALELLTDTPEAAKHKKEWDLEHAKVGK